jgi:hypothetical protein
MMSLSTSNIAALFPLTGYFLLILCLHALLPPTALPISPPKSFRHALFHILALVSLGLTWYYMLSFMKWSYTDYHKSDVLAISIQSLAPWLRETHLFEQAWRIVCGNLARWWWSSQLCTFTAGIWSVFLWEQCTFTSTVQLIVARKRGIRRPWVYMAIGQIVAISYASALFYAVREANPAQQKRSIERYASRRLVWTTITATITSCFLYYALWTPYYLLLLLVVHLLLFLPLAEPSNAPLSNVSISHLYSFNGILCVLLHWGNSVLLFQRGELESIFLIFNQHPAMSSIGWDIVCCGVIGVIGTRRIKSITLPIIISLGGTMGGIHTLFHSQIDEIR